MSTPLEELVEKLRALVPDGESKGFAARAGLRPETLSRLRTGEATNPTLETLTGIASALGMTVSELVSPYEDLPWRAAEDHVPYGAGFDLQEPDGAPREYLQVPLMASEVCAGPGADMTDEVEGWHAMRLDWVAGHVVNKPVRLRVARSHVGESMSNTILPGAILTVDLGPVEEVTPGAIYIVQDENAGVMVKRVYPLPEEGSFLCMSDNRSFSPFRIREEEGGRLLGRVLRWEQGEENGPTV